jgi:hypothetical protein
MASLRPYQRGVIASLAFVASFALLGLLQFSERARFASQSGPIAVTGIRRAADGAAEASGFPLELKVSFRGIAFTFGSGRPIAVTTKGGGQDLVMPLSWTQTVRNVSVLFDLGIRLDFEVSASGDAFSVNTAFDDSSISGVTIPYSLSGASFEANLGERLSVRTRAGVFTLGLPETTRLDAERSTLSMGERKNAFSLAAVRRPAKATARPEGASTPPSLDDRGWNAVLATWLDRAYSGLSRGRYSPSLLAWRTGTQTAFTEDALVALIAESLRRGSYAEARPTVSAIAKSRDSELGWKSSVYLGDIIDKAGALPAADAAAATGLRASLASRDPQALLFPGLVHFCVDRVPALLEPLLSLAAEVDPDSMDVQTSAGALICLVEAEEYFPDANNPFVRLESAALGAIASATVKTDAGAFLVSEPNVSRLELQVRVGAAMIKAGRIRDDESAASLGRALAAGALALADQDGVLPERVAVRDGKVLDRTGTLAPETIYQTVADNPYYPRPRSLFKEAGKGTWILTCSPRVGVEWSQGQGTVSADWQSGSTHYMAVFGLNPIVLMKLYDIPYNPDPEFDRYNASGYLYSRASRILFLKMKHKSDREYVRMNF